MEAVLAVAVGAFFASGIYLMLSRHIIRLLIGIALFGNAVNLLIFTAGRIVSAAPPIIPEGQDTIVAATANPLPQALILTAIVIGFGLLVFALCLAYRSYYVLGVTEMDAMRAAEPEGRD